jgi:uncharacterized protein (UPF0548 family)
MPRFSLEGVTLTMQPSDTYLADLVEQLDTAPLTYSEHGQTGSENLPAGYHYQQARAVIGRGNGAWDKAKDGLLTWQCHRRAGLTVYPSDAPLDPGTVVVAAAHLGPFYLLIPCRVIYRTDDPGRFGFAYGTLPGHPERGEEAFHVVRDEAGTVSFEVVAFSKPADLLTKLGGPVSRLAQAAATRRYLEGIKAHVSTGA